MSDKIFGLCLQTAALLVAAAILGYKKARHDQHFGASSVIGLALLLFPWLAGIVASYPSYVEFRGENAYIRYMFATLVIHFIVGGAGWIFWTWFFKGFNKFVMVYHKGLQAKP